MNTATVTAPMTEMLALISQLEPGQIQVFHHVNWADYEKLLAELGNSSGLRTAYTEGDLEIMAPLYRHEADKEMLTAMVRLLAKAHGLRAIAAGSTIFKRKDLGLGAEPDSCYYLRDVTKVIGKTRIELGIDPPPDLVIEVDLTNHSRSKSTTYARFGVPEFWRYDAPDLEIFELVAGQYQQRATSPTFPLVQATELAAFLEQSKTAGQDHALEAFETWLKTRRN